MPETLFSTTDWHHNIEERKKHASWSTTALRWKHPLMEGHSSSVYKHKTEAQESFYPPKRNPKLFKRNLLSNQSFRTLS